MNLSYFTASVEEDNVYKLQINDIIGRMVDGAQVADEIDFLNKSDEPVSRIEIEINSEGGSITNGIKIVSAMLASKIPVDTFNRGYAASMAGVIFIAGRKRRMVDFGILMIHNPRSGGIDLKEITNPKEKEILQLMKNQLMQLIINRTGINKQVLSELMDQETWMDFDKAKSYGFVDGSPVVYRNAPELSRAASADIKAIQEFYNSMENSNINNLKQNQMEEKLQKQYEARIEERDATISEQAENIAKIRQDHATLKTDYENILTERDNALQEVKSLKEEKVNLLSQIKDFKDAESVKMVQNAIAKGLFPQDKEQELVEQAKADPKGFEKIVNLMSPTAKKLEGNEPPKISQIIEHAEALAGIKEDDLNGLTEFEYLQRNNSAKLEKIRTTDPKLYEAMKDKYLNAYK